MPALNVTTPSLLFASCNNPLMPFSPSISGLWSSMVEQSPAGFVWAGDAVYGDRMDFHGRFSRPTRVQATAQVLSDLYSSILGPSNPYYPLPSAYHLGTLDDHDLGANNGDGSFELSRNGVSNEAFVDFIERSNEGYYAGGGGEGGEDAVKERSRRSKGVYGVKVFDFDDGGRVHHEPREGGFPAGAGGGGRTVAVFFLDCRTNKDPWPRGFDFDGGKGAGLDFLGAEQWEWFEASLKASTAHVNLVVNGLQVLSQSRVPNGNLAEDWEKFPQAKERLLEAAMGSGARNVVLVSGDVHMAQLMGVRCRRRGGGGGAEEALYELTTSGITHSWGTFFSPDPRQRELWYFPYMRWCSAAFMDLAHWAMPWKEVIRGEGGELKYR